MVNEQKRKPIGILLTVILIAALLTICLELGLSYLHPDTPGSIPKHLIHFGIMFALLGSAVLLCLFCPPFKKLWAWIDQHILDKETRPIAIDIIYAVIAGLMLLHHFYVLLYYPTIPAGATKLAPVWIIFAASTVLLGKSWREICFRLASILLLFTFERLYIKNLNITNGDIVYFASAIYSMFICLGIFSTVRETIWKSFLQIVCAIWTLNTLIISIAGLFMGWTGATIKNLVETTIYIEKGRLSIFSAATITAGILGGGSIIALIGFAVSKHKPVKILYLLSCLIIMIANSLTDARASFISLALMIAGTLCIGIWSTYRNKKVKKTSGMKIALIAIALFLSFMICFFGAVEGQRILGARFIEARNNGSIIIPSAVAEETITEVVQEQTSIPEPPLFEQRDVWYSEDTNIIMMFSYRTLIWQRVFDYIQQNPQTLLYGLSMDGNANIDVVKNPHCHNLLLQTLLEGGIPALILYLSLVFYGVFHAFRLWARRGVPFWQRVLPLPVFSILLWEMAECLTHFSFGHPPMTLFWFFLGATITVSKSLGKAPRTAEHPAIPAESAVTETGE